MRLLPVLLSVLTTAGVASAAVEIGRPLFSALPDAPGCPRWWTPHGCAGTQSHTTLETSYRPTATATSTRDPVPEPSSSDTVNWSDDITLELDDNGWVWAGISVELWEHVVKLVNAWIGRGNAGFVPPKF